MTSDSVQDDVIAMDQTATWHNEKPGQYIWNNGFKDADIRQRKIIKSKLSFYINILDSKTDDIWKIIIL